MSRRRTGRPTKEPGEARDKRIVIWVNARERARYLVNASRAGLTGADYARGLLCHDSMPTSAHNAKSPAIDSPPDTTADFQLIDALSRLGVDLHKIAPIIRETTEVPGEIEAILDRLDRLLDRLLPR